MSDQDKEREQAEIRAQAKAEMNREMGLSDSEDENENRESPYDYMPYLVSYPKGSAKEIEAALRMRGLQLRRDLNQSLSQNPEAWKALNRPAPLHSASLTLAEMLRDIPQNDHEQFHELGEGYVYMPLNIMEKYLYPTLRLMQFLHTNAGERLPAGVDTMMAYSFFQQGMGPPKNRTEYDLEILRNTVSSSGNDLEDQLRNSSDAVDGLSNQLKKTLKKLETFCKLPDTFELAEMSQDELDTKQAEIDTCLQLYKDQITIDYDAFKLQKERVIMLSHLAQRQSADNLDLNLRMIQIAKSNEIQIDKEVEDKIVRKTFELENTISNTLIQHRELLRVHLNQATSKITPYDVTDMERFISAQKKALTDTYEQNALLVSSNAELRMFLSFMPIKYREYVSKLRAESSILYRQQRISPKVIQTNDKGAAIKLVDAPMADPTVQYALRDAEYANLREARLHMERGIALRNRTLSDPATKVFPKSAPPGDQPPPSIRHTKSASPGDQPPPSSRNTIPATRYAPTSANEHVRKELRTKTVHDYRPTTLVPDGEEQQDDQDNHPTPTSQLHPKVQAYLARTQGQDSHVPPSHQDKGMDTYDPEDYTPPSYKGKGGKGKRGPPQMSNRHQPPIKFSKYDNPAASQQLLDTVRGGKATRPPKPSLPSKQVIGNPQPSPANLTRGQVGIPPISENPIKLFNRSEAIREYNFTQPNGLPPSGQCLPFEDMERILRKYMPESDSSLPIEIPEYDQDMATYMVERLHQAHYLPDEFVYEHMHGTTRILLDIDGNKPRLRGNPDPKNLYKMLPLRMIPIVGDYYSILRQRPTKQSDAFEYMPNAKYAYRRVKRDLAQLNVDVLPSRMWHENPTQAIPDEQLHPYVAWFPCNSFQFEQVETILGISHIPYGNEIAWRQSAPTATGKPRLIVDNLATVQRLLDYGLMVDDSKDNLLSYKALFDDQIDLATMEKEKSPFGLAHKVLTTHINRWSKISRALGAIAKPHSAYGTKVFDLPDESDDRKRKAGPESLASSSPSVMNDDDENGTPRPQQQADNNTDRQNPEGSGGNPI